VILLGLLSLLLLVIATAALLLVVPVMAACKKRVSAPTFTVWLVGVALFVTWFVVTAQEGFRSDREPVEGDIFNTIGWLIAAAVVASAALVVQRRNPIS
jgi:hypothetical protein